ncbi:hypothetical protein F4802DRAFT_601087 [Xylaria palmicola]|nr:hypothetical protein F4802DRAFT_601087 [Xylaria palmicola]
MSSRRSNSSSGYPNTRLAHTTPNGTRYYVSGDSYMTTTVSAPPGWDVSFTVLSGTSRGDWSSESSSASSGYGGSATPRGTNTSVRSWLGAPGSHTSSRRISSAPSAYDEVRPEDSISQAPRPSLPVVPEDRRLAWHGSSSHSSRRESGSSTRRAHESSSHSGAASRPPSSRHSSHSHHSHGTHASSHSRSHHSRDSHSNASGSHVSSSSRRHHSHGSSSHASGSHVSSSSRHHHSHSSHSHSGSAHPSRTTSSYYYGWPSEDGWPSNR